MFVRQAVSRKIFASGVFFLFALVIPLASAPAQDPILGEVRLVGFNFAHRGWADCQGQLLPINRYSSLFAVIGTTYGGDGETTFALPDLRGRTAAHPRRGADGARIALGQASGGAEVRRADRPGLAIQPYLGLRYVIALQGLKPSRLQPGDADATPGEIRLFTGKKAPAGWMFCDGQVLEVSKNRGLFSVLGSAYGGDGKQTFAVPDLRGRAALHAGAGPGLPKVAAGQRSGGSAAENSEKTLRTRPLLGVHYILARGPSGNALREQQENAKRLEIAEARGKVLSQRATRSNVDLQLIEAQLRLLELDPKAPEVRQSADALRARQKVVKAEFERERKQSDRIYRVIRELRRKPLPARREPFIGEIRMFAGKSTPRAWAPCDGQLLPVSQNDALFSLLGTMYGGDGRTTFALPDLRGRIPVGAESGKKPTDIRQGAKGGGQYVLKSRDAGKSVRTTPTLAIRYLISLYGIFPSRR